MNTGDKTLDVVLEKRERIRAEKAKEEAEKEGSKEGQTASDKKAAEQGHNPPTTQGGVSAVGITGHRAAHNPFSGAKVE